jgi:hypothetical protein
MRGGMLLECEAFGVPEGLWAFVLSASAQVTFDEIVSEYIRNADNPFIPCRSRPPNKCDRHR